MFKIQQLFPVLVLLSVLAVSLQQPPGVPPRQPYQPSPHGQQQGHQGQQQQDNLGHQGKQQQESHGHQGQQQQESHGHQVQQQQESHGHGHHETPLKFASEVHNADHILEHLEKVVSTKSKEEMTQEELEFHYFKLHDYDHNNQLDGVEIMKALTHFHIEDNSTASSEHKLPPIMSDEDLAKTVDGILNTFDQDKNGYVEYFEFKRMSTGAQQDTAA